jgi:protein SCO1/2
MKKAFPIFLLLILSFISIDLLAIEKPEVELEPIKMATELGAQIDKNLEFIDSSGKNRTINEFFLPNKPLIIVPAYYTCPRLCGLLLNGVSDLLKKLDLKLGVDYSIITVSFNNKDDYLRAQGQEIRFRKQVSENVENTSAWNFLVGKESSIYTLMTGLGFNYKRENEDFAHTAALFILTPDGKISQYFTGIEFSAWDVKLALIEAASGSIGTAIDHVMLFCFKFDPLKGRYTWAAINFMRLGGALTLAFIVGLFFYLRKKEKPVSI